MKVDPKLHFEGEEAGEEVLFFLRAHPITTLTWVIITIFLLIVPFVLKAFLDYADIILIIDSQTVLLSVVSYFLVILGFSFQQFLHWYFNIYILTNKRLVDIDFFGLFYRRVSQTTLDNVQDLTFSKGGVFQNFFDYGDLHIQTAGTAPNFEFCAIPDPEGNQKRILELVEKRRRNLL